MFNSLFKKKKEVPDHIENWQVYFSRINNQIASVIVDLNVATIAPIKHYSEVFYLIIPFDFASEDGLPTRESYAILDPVEDKIQTLRAKYAPKMMFVATISMNSERLLMFYCNKISDSHEMMHQLEATFSGQLTFQIDHREDPKWDDYFELAYPLPFQLEMIKNRMTLQKVTESGDRLSAAREVFHYIYFNQEADATAFWQQMEPDNFSLNSKQKVLSEWQVCISRSDYISYDQIDDLCLPIWEKAQVYNGRYDGWETEVVL